MNYILLHSAYGHTSMRMTAAKMKEPVQLLVKRKNGEWLRQFDFPIFEYENIGNRVMQFIGAEENRVINWGNHIFSDDSLFDLNKPSGISLASDKRRSRRFLQDEGVKVPETQFYAEWLKFPCIARPSFHHGGRHFYLLNSEKDLQDLSSKEYLADWYFAQIFPKTTEFRVHVGHGKVLFIQEKPLVEGELRANQAVNHESWRVLKWSEFHPGVCQESIEAIEFLGLDYGAVDIMYNSQNDTWAICEVNTSPSINTPYSSEKYAAYFDWVIRHGFPAHLPMTEGTNVFYSEMLRE